MKTAQTKRSIAVAIFNGLLSTLPATGARVFRQNALVKIETEAGVTRQSAAAMYDFAKKQAVEQGLVEPFGRVAGAAPKAKAAKVIVPEGRWQIVDKASGKVVGAADSRRKAQAAKADGQIVRDSEK